MPLLFRLAWRNIWRNRRRSMITITAIAFATAILQFFISIQLQSYSAAIRATTGIFPGHIQIQHDDYLDHPRMRLAFDDTRRLRDTVLQSSGVKALAPRASAFALAASEERSAGFQIVGVDPEKEPHVSSIPAQIKRGRYFNSIDEQALLMGNASARKLKIEPGDLVTLLGQGWDGSLAAAAFPVIGIFDSGSVEIDQGVIQTPLAVFQSTFSMPGKVHSLVLSVKELTEADQTSSEISSALRKSTVSSQLTARSWEEILPGLKESIQLDMTAGWLFFFSLVAIVAFGVMNTFLMSIMERTREFGVVIALGARVRKLQRMVALESLFLTAGGILLGVTAGGCVVLYFSRVGFSIPGSEELMKVWNLPSRIYPEITAATLAVPTAFVLVTILISVLYPLWKIRGIDPSSVVRSG